METDIRSRFRKCMHTAPDGYTMPYRLYIPKDYDCGEQYPLLIYLHGTDSRGDDNEKQLNALLNWFNQENSPVYNAIVLAPQCPEEKQWVNCPLYDGVYSTAAIPESRESQAVLEILTRVMEFCNIDADRVYLTGTSMGGFGTWDMLTRHGSRFAAGVPVCGGVDVTKASLLKRIPVWQFHGSADTTVLPEGSRYIFAEIRKAGGEEIRYTEYSGTGHNVWDLAYNDGDMHAWLFRQSRRERRLLAERKAKQKKTAILAGGGAGTVFLSLAALLLIKKKQKSKNTADKTNK